MLIITMSFRMLIINIKCLTRHVMGLNNLVTNLGNGVTKMLDHNKKEVKKYVY